MSEACIFCDRVDVDGLQAAVAFDDAFPVSAGHRLVIPRRHVERLEELADDEWDAVFALVRAESRRLAGDPEVDAVNIGVNSGRAAGQTVAHAHVHVIPRRCGDVHDPRGGVRWVVPDGADYWTER